MAINNIVALILAGGQGSRLGSLTSKYAKPAVAFGGKYRIIDFALSNCSTSGLTTDGVLTQYMPQALNSHIGIGSPWDLDRTNGGVTMLAPYMSVEGGDWYKGTANAVYQNLNYLEKNKPEYVLILSGDHIYKMDYSNMLKNHIVTDSGVTIAVINVPLNEASRFGIMTINEEGKILEFEEKPKNPKSTLASMGVYIFTYEKLKQYLEEDKRNIQSQHDFGKNIIPTMLTRGEKMTAYEFDGYWKDVGTVESYWEAHMDLLCHENDVKLFDTSWKIYTNTAAWPPQYISEEAKLQNCIISEGSVIHGSVKSSIIFPGVVIGKNTNISESIIMTGTVIEDNVIINKAIIQEDVYVKKNNVIGDGKEIVVIESNKMLESGFHGNKGV